MHAFTHSFIHHSAPRETLNPTSRASEDDETNVERERGRRRATRARAWTRMTGTSASARAGAAPRRRDDVQDDDDDEEERDVANIDDAWSSLCARLSADDVDEVMGENALEVIWTLERERDERRGMNPIGRASTSRALETCVSSAKSRRALIYAFTSRALREMIAIGDVCERDDDESSSDDAAAYVSMLKTCACRFDREMVHLFVTTRRNGDDVESFDLYTKACSYAWARDYGVRASARVAVLKSFVVADEALAKWLTAGDGWASSGGACGRRMTSAMDAIDFVVDDALATMEAMFDVQLMATKIERSIDDICDAAAFLADLASTSDQARRSAVAEIEERIAGRIKRRESDETGRALMLLHASLAAPSAAFDDAVVREILGDSEAFISDLAGARGCAVAIASAICLHSTAKQLTFPAASDLVRAAATFIMENARERLLPVRAMLDCIDALGEQSRGLDVRELFNARRIDAGKRVLQAAQKSEWCDVVAPYLFDFETQLRETSASDADRFAAVVHGWNVDATRKRRQVCAISVLETVLADVREFATLSHACGCSKLSYAPPTPSADECSAEIVNAVNKFGRVSRVSTLDVGGLVRIQSRDIIAVPCRLGSNREKLWLSVVSKIDATTYCTSSSFVLLDRNPTSVHEFTYMFAREVVPVGGAATKVDANDELVLHVAKRHSLKSTGAFGRSTRVDVKSALEALISVRRQISPVAALTKVSPSESASATTYITLRFESNADARLAREKIHERIDALHRACSTTLLPLRLSLE